MKNQKEQLSLRTCALAALAECLPHNLPSHSDSLEVDYLSGFLNRLQEIGCTWAEALQDICKQPLPGDQALIQRNASSRSIGEKLLISPLIANAAILNPHSTHFCPPITPIFSKSFLCVRPK